MISSFLQHFININMEQSSLLVRRSYLRSYDEALRFVPFYISNPRNHRMKYMSELTSRTDTRGEARQVVPKARRGTTNKTAVICYGALFP
jgi:hypothetical protein